MTTECAGACRNIIFNWLAWVKIIFAIYQNGECKIIKKKSTQVSSSLVEMKTH